MIGALRVPVWCLFRLTTHSIWTLRLTSQNGEGSENLWFFYFPFFVLQNLVFLIKIQDFCVFYSFWGTRLAAMSACWIMRAISRVNMALTCSRRGLTFSFPGSIKLIFIPEIISFYVSRGFIDSYFLVFYKFFDDFVFFCGWWVRVLDYNTLKRI